MKLVRTIVTGEPCNVCGYMGDHTCSNVAVELTSTTAKDVKAIREGLLAWQEGSLSPTYEQSLLDALVRIERHIETLEGDLWKSQRYI